MTTATPDVDALFAALVLAPATYSRNRFFDLYRDPAVRRARRRARLVRDVLATLVGGAEAGPARVVAVRAAGDAFAITYEVEALGLRRTTALDALELAVLRYALGRAPARDGRARPEELGGGGPAEDRARVEALLARLAP